MFEYGPVCPTKADLFTRLNQRAPSRTGAAVAYASSAGAPRQNIAAKPRIELASKSCSNLWRGLGRSPRKEFAVPGEFEQAQRRPVSAHAVPTDLACCTGHMFWRVIPVAGAGEISDLKTRVEELERRELWKAAAAGIA